MPSQNRKVQYVGEQIQRVLATRAAFHWCFCLAVVFMSVLLSHMASQPELGIIGNCKATWLTMGAPVLLGACFLPWVIIDSLRLSNRFSGPLARIRRNLQTMQAGVPVAPIRVRERDFFQDIVQEINSLAASLDQSGSRAAAPLPTGALSNTTTPEPENGQELVEV